jgi:hypothetical protein
MQKTKGSVAVVDDGTIIMLSVLEKQSAPDSAGRIHLYSVGTILGGSRQYPAGSRWAGSPDQYRVVAHIDDALELLQAAGVEFSVQSEPEVEQLHRRISELKHKLQTGKPSIAIDTLASTFVAAGSTKPNQTQKDKQDE